MQDVRDATRPPRVSHVRRTLPRIVVLAAAVYLVGTWVAVYAVDARNLAGIRDLMVGLDLEMPHLWYHLHGDSHLTQMLQWGLLGATSLVAAVLAGRLQGRGTRGAGAFWLLFAVGTTLMLIEDAGDPRHQIAGWMATLLPGERLGTVLGELVVLVVIAGVPLWALVRHGRWPWAHPQTRGYLAGGVGVYGLAAALTVTGPFLGPDGWYERAGRWMADTLFGGRLLEAAPLRGLDDPLGYQLMDSMVEESLELAGAALLLAAVLAYAQAVRAGTEPSLTVDRRPRR